MSFWYKYQSPESDGPVWAEGRFKVPRIADAYLECVVYCYRTAKDAERGTQSGGCGFLVTVPLGGGDLRTGLNAFAVASLHAADLWATLPHLYAVTNWHVAKEYPFVRLTQRDGPALTVDGSGRWQRDPINDLAVLPIPWDFDWPYYGRLFPIPCGHLLTEASMHMIDAGIGDDTFTVGRFINHDGRRLNHPVVRFGNIAMMPSRVHIRGVGDQTCFLIESRTIPGYSGSPVFLRVPSWELRESAGVRSKLHGFAADYNKDAPGASALTWLLGITVGFGMGTKVENTGMMEVIPSWLLTDLLSSAPLIAQRTAEADERRDWPGAAPCDSSSNA